MLQENLLYWLILLPLISALMCLVLRDKVSIQRYINLACSVLLLLGAGLLFVLVRSNSFVVSQAGGWVAPFGITLIADMLSAIMVFLCALIFFGVSLFSLAAIDLSRERFGYYPCLQFLMVGLMGSFLTGDIFNLFVWFEVMLISSFVLLALGGARPQLEGSIKYVTLNLFSSSIFLAGVGVLYGLTGTLNMAHLAVLMKESVDPSLANLAATLFLVSFGIKAGVFPLFFWLPASYHTAPAVIAALLGGLLTKVGVYALIRVFTLIFTQDPEYTHGLLLWSSGLTMVIGVLGAAAQREFRRTLSFHIISQVGYMVMGLALYTPLALTGAIFYIIHHIIVKTNLFLVSGVVTLMRGTDYFKKLGGIYKTNPYLSMLFLISALSLAGVPPLSGFWGKLIVMKAAIDIASFEIAVVALAVGLLTLFSMTKVWAEVFWKDRPEDDYSESRGLDAPVGGMTFLLAPIALFAACTVGIGIFSASIFEIAEEASEQLFNSAGYIQAVLGPEGGR